MGRFDESVCIRLPRAWRFTFGDQKYIAVSAAAHAMLLLLAFSIPPEARSLALEGSGNRRIVRYFVAPPVRTERGRLELVLPGPDHPGGAARAVSPRAPSRALETARGPEPRRMAERAAKSAGILPLLERLEGSHVAALWHSDGILGPGGERLLTDLRATPGFGDLGGGDRTGPGRGGGTRPGGLIPLGHISTIGKESAGTSRLTSGVARLAPRRAGSADPAREPVAFVRGSLDRTIVRRVVRQHLNEVKFCYEQAALGRPDLHGRVEVQFVIGPSGAVLEAGVARATTGDLDVESCIARAVRRWSFPQPAGGGVVIVSYPFVLQMAGS